LNKTGSEFHRIWWCFLCLTAVPSIRGQKRLTQMQHQPPMDTSMSSIWTAFVHGNKTSCHWRIYSFCSSLAFLRVGVGLAAIGCVDFWPAFMLWLRVNCYINSDKYYGERFEFVMRWVFEKTWEKCWLLLCNLLWIHLTDKPNQCKS